MDTTHEIDDKYKCLKQQSKTWKTCMDWIPTRVWTSSSIECFVKVLSTNIPCHRHRHLLVYRRVLPQQWPIIAGHSSTELMVSLSLLMAFSHALARTYKHTHAYSLSNPGAHRTTNNNYKNTGWRIQRVQSDSYFIILTIFTPFTSF